MTAVSWYEKHGYLRSCSVHCSVSCCPKQGPRQGFSCLERCFLCPPLPMLSPSSFAQEPRPGADESPSFQKHNPNAILLSLGVKLAHLFDVCLVSSDA